MHVDSLQVLYSELCSRGIFTAPLDAGQIGWVNALRANLDDSVWCIGRQRGKTFAATAEALETCATQPGTIVNYCAKTKESAGEIFKPTLEQLLSYVPEKLKPKRDDQHGKVIWPNGSIIKWAGTDAQTFDRLRGPFCHRILLDESAFYQHLDRVESALLPQLTTTRDKGGRALYLSTPPLTPDHEFTERYNAAKLNGLAQHSTIHDNPRLTAGMVDRILTAYAKKHGLTNEQAQKSSFWRREYLAEFVIETERAIVPEWDASCVREFSQDEYFPHYHKYVSLDLGVEDYTVALFAYYDFQRATLYVLDEYAIKGPELTTPVLAEAIKQKQSEHFGNHRVYKRVSDNNNPHLLNDLSSGHGLPFVPTDKEYLQAMVNKVRVWSQNKRIVVHPRCKHLSGCLSMAIWDGTKGQRVQFGRSTSYGHYDALASLIYLIRNVNESTNPVPTTFGMDPMTHHINDNLLQKQNPLAAFVFGDSSK